MAAVILTWENCHTPVKTQTLCVQGRSGDFVAGVHVSLVWGNLFSAAHQGNKRQRWWHEMRRNKPLLMVFRWPKSRKLDLIKRCSNDTWRSTKKIFEVYFLLRKQKIVVYCRCLIVVYVYALGHKSKIAKPRTEHANRTCPWQVGCLPTLC